jgi:Rap1a immunity proteins
MKERAGMRYAIPILLTLMAHAHAAEDLNSANYFLPGCRALIASDGDTNQRRAVYCLAFVDGLAFPASSRFCVPANVTLGQVVRVVVKYVETLPERHHDQFGDLALEALERAWPCKRP